MSLTNLLSSTVQSVKSGFLSLPQLCLTSVRHAAKKTSGATKNKKGHPRPKHRGWKVQDGHVVNAGHIVVLQRKTRFHPGLHVGFGKNGTLFAIEKGKVVVTCEKVNLNPDHTWVQGNYSGRLDQTIYKKHFNVIPEKQHTNFKQINLV